LTYNDLQKIPELPQRQDSLMDQLYDLRAVADRLGMYDASDLLIKLILKNSKVKRGKNA